MTQTPGPLAGRTAIVTGSGRNIGRAIAIRLAADGARVVVNGHRDVNALEGVVDDIEAAGGTATACLADVSNPEDVKTLVAHATARFGAVDVLVSNVATRRHQAFLDISPEDWRHTCAVNLDAAFYLSQAVLPTMRERGFGRMIFISGLDGFTGHVPNRAHNLVCKAGLHALAKGIALEFGPFGITANTVAPGAVDTERDWSQYPGESNAGWAAKLPTGRMVRTDEIAGACAYLARDDAGSMTGQVMHVNGGQFMF